MCMGIMRVVAVAITSYVTGAVSRAGVGHMPHYLSGVSRVSKSFAAAHSRSWDWSNSYHTFLDLRGLGHLVVVYRLRGGEA